MTLIGELEQLGLSFVLQEIETNAKTGLLEIKRGTQCVELYFRDGRLMCIGPIRANATLWDRLVRAGVISPQALQEAIFSIGVAQPNETRIALTLIDLGYVNHEGLRTWAMKEASEVLEVLLKWKTGQLYFEDHRQPPDGRLLVAISITLLLPTPPLTPPLSALSATPSPSTLRIFVSHSNKDDDFGTRLVDDLRHVLADEMAVWYDSQGGLHGGDNWWRKIIRELTERNVFIVVLSPDAMDSDWVNDEIDLAWRQKNSPQRKRIILVLYRECEVREDLANLQIISFLPPKTYEAAFNELLTALRLPIEFRMRKPKQ